MEHVGRARHLDLRRQSHNSGLHGVVRASLCCKRFVAHLARWPPLVGMNSRRYQHESEFRFALFQANQQIQNVARKGRGEDSASISRRSWEWCVRLLTLPLD
jgi:hypothetical protein